MTQPSDVVVMENVLRDNTKGRAETVQAKFELLKRGSYLMNQDAARLNVKPLEPGAPLDLAEARNAVELARLAGADRYAADTFTKATGLLAEAEQAREKRRGNNAIMMPARQAAQTAEDARLVALQRQEEEFQAEQRRLAQAREADATARARGRGRAAPAGGAERAGRHGAARRGRAGAGRGRQRPGAAEAERQRAEAERQRAEAALRDAEAEASRANSAAAQRNARSSSCAIACASS